MSGGKKSSILTVSIEILLTLIMSVISYYVIETPIRKGIIAQTFNLLKEKKYNTKLKKRSFNNFIISCPYYFKSFMCCFCTKRNNVE